MQYTTKQSELIYLKKAKKTFLSGKAGTGKTSAAVERVCKLLDKSLSETVLVFAPTFRHQLPYLEIISKKGRTPEVSSYNAFVQKCISLFWPLAAEKTEFDGSKSPFFLDIDSEQIIMSKLIQKRMNEGQFASLSSSASRICNQIVIAIHKCAAAMIPFDKYPEIMKKSWCGEKTFLPLFDRVYECGEEFKSFCIKNNLLDYSLQLDIFNKYILPDKTFKTWINKKKINFIFDNLEEEVPAAHHFVREMDKEFRSMLLISDSGAGYRSFMGADCVSAEYLKDTCDTKLVFTESFTENTDIEALEKIIADPKLSDNDLSGNPKNAFELESERQFAKMIKDAVLDVSDLINNKGVDPHNIVILSPLVSDLLYTEMERGLADNGIKAYLHRPSRPLMNEKVTRSLITLSSLVDPENGLEIKPIDIAQLLLCFVSGIDPIRCQIYVTAAYKPVKQESGKTFYEIKEFSSLKTPTKERFTSEMEEKFEKIRIWIEKEREKTESTPDKIVYDFFNEIASKEGFICDEKTSLGVCKILESMQRFKNLQEYIGDKKDEDKPTWSDFFYCVSTGAVKATYNEDVYAQPKDAVLISLVSTYLSSNRNSEYQVWLNIASPRWRNKIVGELTNDLVLSRNWSGENAWTTAVLEDSNETHMKKQVCGLLRRCTKKVLAYSCEMDESGSPQKGKLLNIFGTINRRFRAKNI